MASEPSIHGVCGVEMSREITSGGRSSQNHSGGVHGGGVRQVFSEMSGWVQSSVGAGLCVFVRHVLYPVTNEVLHQVYDIYEATTVQMLVTTNAWNVKALAWFRTGHDAEHARHATHGHNIYDRCCLLDILPCAGTSATTIKCATTGPSRDDGMAMAMATPTVAALGPPTVLTTSTTTRAMTAHLQVVAPPTQDADDEVYEVSEEPKETVQELCTKMLAMLNCVLEGSRYTIPDATSHAMGMDHTVVVAYPCSSTTYVPPMEQKVALEAVSTKHGGTSDLPKATPIKYSTSVPDVSVDTNLVAGVLLPMTDMPHVIPALIGDLIIESSIQGTYHLDTDVPTVACVKCSTFSLDVNDDTDPASKAFLLTNGLWYNPNVFEVFHGTLDRRRMEMRTGFWELEFFSNGAEVR